MVEQGARGLRLVGLHDDGEHLVLAGPGDQRFTLPINDALRAAVRRDRPRLEHLQSQAAGFLPPREIQARVRAGLTAEEISAAAGISVEQVRRYEGPVLAEREFIASKATATRVGRDSGSPTLGDLVTDRLAARGVDTSELAWDAARPDGHGWIVSVGFEVGGQERLARWTFDSAAQTLHALEDEARWLSETEIVDEPIPRRHLAAVRASVFDVEADAIRPVLDAVDAQHSSAGQRPDIEDPPSELDVTSAILEDLRERRGVRHQPGDDDAAFEGFGPPSAFHLDVPGHPRRLEDAPGAHPADADERLSARVYPMPGGARGDDLIDADASPDPSAAPSRSPAGVDAPLVDAPMGASTDETPVTGEADDTDDASRERVEPPVTRARPARRSRSKVPSWDEIVFGAKPE